MFPYLASTDTFAPTKIVLKVGFLERDFERDHLVEKSNRAKMGQKNIFVNDFFLFILGYMVEFFGNFLDTWPS
jgi:hypothetical protein